MTVTTTTNSTSYTGNGTTTAFAFPYIFFQPTDLIVTLVVTATAVAVAPPPVLNGAATYDYTVSGVLADGEYASGATVTFNTAPLATHTVIIHRAVPATQTVTLIDNTKFPAKTVNTEFDKLTVLAQQSSTLAVTSLQIPGYEAGLVVTAVPAANRANRILLWDALGNLSTIDPANLIGGSVPSGPAGGALSGTYPTPSLVGGPLSNYAPLASPALTGTPTAPTATPGDSDNSIATTAFVQAAITGSLRIFSETVLASPANSIAVTIPTSPRLVRLVFGAQSTGAVNDTFYLQAMVSGTPYTTANYETQQANGSSTTAYANLTTGATGYVLTGGIYAEGFWETSWLASPIGLGHMGTGQVFEIQSGGVRTLRNLGTYFNTVSPASSAITGFRLTPGLNNFAAGSYLRCLVVP